MASNPPPRNANTLRLRAIARELHGAPDDYDADEPPTTPGVLPATPPRQPMASGEFQAQLPSPREPQPDDRAANLIIRILLPLPPAARLPALALILGSLLIGFYLWKTLS